MYSKIKIVLRNKLRHTILWPFYKHLSTVKNWVLDKGGPLRIPKGVTVQDFINKLNDQRVNYVVLRWFEDLPNVEPGEDLDLLVDDADFDIVKSFLVQAQRTGGIKVDIRTVYPTVRGTGTNGCAYYPPPIAKELINNSIVHAKSSAKVPNEKHHFLSLAYHALYHKGYRSGLMVSKDGPCYNQNPEHDYETTLKKLAAKIHINAEMTMNSLDDILKDNGWRPPLDMLDRMGGHNQYCALLASKEYVNQPMLKGLTTFIVRSRGAHKETMNKITFELSERGYHIIEIIDLDKKIDSNALDYIRGGNWSRGPYPCSGGHPSKAIVCLNRESSIGSDTVNARDPLSKETKEAIRSLYNEQVAEIYHCNIIHSSDHPLQAAHYLEIIAPEKYSSIIEKAKNIIEQKCQNS